MTSSLTSTDKPTAMKQPFSQQATTTADHEFDKMDVKEIKRFISARVFKCPLTAKLNLFS